MSRKPVICVLGLRTEATTVGPKDGVCDYIFFDSLYATTGSSFYNLSPAPFQWFTKFAENNKQGSTQFGVSVDFK